MSAQWYKGIPPVIAVSAHETLHPRQDGITWISDIQVSYDEKDHRIVKGDARLFGNWIINHVKSSIDPYVGIGRLKVIDGEVFMALGFCYLKIMLDKL